MVYELALIQKLERIAHLVETGATEVAVDAIDQMIYDLCMQVEQFEMEMAPA
jgi:hypothetical protein